MTLKQWLEATHTEMVKTADGIASVVGDDCWLFIPDLKDTVTPRVCLVAHIDTVHDNDFVWTKGKRNPVQRVDHLVLHDPHHDIYWSPDGLGADDRAGVYAVMTMFEKLTGKNKPYVILTDGEESGGIGAKKAYSSFKDVMGPVMFFIEMDRCGQDDAVFYNNEPKPFRTYIESFGFKEDHGSYSDIASMCESWEVCGTNLSTGFLEEHSESEMLVAGWLEESMVKAMEIIKQAHKKGRIWANDKASRPQYPGRWQSNWHGQHYLGNHSTGENGVNPLPRQDEEEEEGYRGTNPYDDYVRDLDNEPPTTTYLSTIDFWDEVAEYATKYEDKDNKQVLYWCYYCDLHFGPQWDGVATQGKCPLCTGQPFSQYKIDTKLDVRRLKGV